VSGFAAGLDDSRHAGFHYADVDRQQRPGRVVAAVGRRVVAPHQQPALHWRKVSQSLVGECGDGAVIRVGDIWRNQFDPLHCPVSTIRKMVTTDGVEHFSSTKIHCPSCLTRRRSNGEMSYHHAGLAAVLIDPDRPEVFRLD
jgi:hypothetical protein